LDRTIRLQTKKEGSEALRMYAATASLVANFLNKAVIVEVTEIGPLGGVLLAADTKPHEGVDVFLLGVVGMQVLIKHWTCIKTAWSHR